MLTERSTNIEKVKRNLFGAPTKAEKTFFNLQYEKSLEEDRKEMQKKYNFNFRYELPVLLEEQTFDWEEVSTSEVPAMFTPRHIKKPTMKKKPQKAQEEPRKRALASTGRARRRTSNLIKEPTFTMPRRLSTVTKRSHAQIPEEGSPPKTEHKPQKEQARKLRRVTAEFNAFASFRPGRRVSSQRRISDVLDTRRKSPVKSPKVLEKKMLSPKTAAIRKVVELSQVMCPSPDRMMTRSNSKLLSRSSGRRRTLA